jgi:hypothetical protein
MFVGAHLLQFGQVLSASAYSRGRKDQQGKGGGRKLHCSGKEEHDYCSIQPAVLFPTFLTIFKYFSLVSFPIIFMYCLFIYSSTNDLCFSSAQTMLSEISELTAETNMSLTPFLSSCILFIPSLNPEKKLDKPDAIL